MKSQGGQAQRIARIAFLALPTFAFTNAQAFAQQAAVAPEILERMAKEKEARRACKIEICTAFAKPASGSPITCEVTKTWPQPEITSKVVGGSYIWQYGHTQCTVKLSLVSSLMAVDKVSGAVSRAAASEINEFLYSKCKEDGVEIPHM